MRVRTQPTRWICAARACVRGQANRTSEDGFSLIEAIIGLTIIFGSMLVILSGLNTGVRGLLTGRQRQTATSVAKQQIEDVRRACYERIGHDYTDTTLATDADLTFNAGTGLYTHAPTGEKLAKATSSSSCTGDAVVPNPHIESGDSDGTPYSVSTYVTHVEPSAASSGVRHKRVTVTVEWDNEQYESSDVSNTIRLSSLVYDGQEVGGTSGGGGGTTAFPIITSSAVPVAGSFTMTGSLAEAGGAGGTASIDGTTLTYPDANASLRTFLIDEVTGTAKTHSFTVTDSSVSPPTGCTESGNTMSCVGESSTATADSDGGTSPTPPFYEAQTASVVGRSIDSDSDLYSMEVGTGTGDSKSSACDASPCNAPIGDGDGKPYGVHEGSGPSSFGIPFDLGAGISGYLVNVGGGTTARGEVDRDYAASLPRSIATAKNDYSTVNLLEIANTGLLGYGAGLTVVSVGAFDVTTTADIGNSGTGATGASCASSGTVTINVLSALGLTPVPITPCSTTKDETFTSGAQNIVGPPPLNTPIASFQTSTRIVVNPFSETEVADGSGYQEAQARLLDWLTITSTLSITYAGGTVADITVTFDYGDLTATGTRTP